MDNFKKGVIDPREVLEYLKNRNGGFRPVFVHKHKLHDIIHIRQDKDDQWLILAVDQHRMSRLFRIDSDLYFDGRFFYMSADDAS